MRSKRAFKYDVALSFAGEDRKLAKSLARLLQARGFSVFYDKDRQAHLWGRNTQEFEQVYGPQSRFFIPFISKHYVKKDWTVFEFETAKREQQKRQAEFILPINIDDSRILGLSDGVVHLDARQVRMAEVAKKFAEKLRPEGPENHLPPANSSGVWASSLLSAEAQRGLRIIATAALPLLPAHYRRLFPQLNWNQLIALYSRAGLITLRGGLIHAKRGGGILNSLEPTNHKEYEALWIARLGEFRGHVDAALFLCLHLLRAKLFAQAASVVVDVATQIDLGSWNNSYIKVLEQLSRPRLLKHFAASEKVRLLNAWGLCLAYSGDHRSALKKFERVYALSKNHRDSWGIGQSLLNAGVAANEIGNDDASSAFYELAAHHANRVKDFTLLGRALGNLSQLQMSINLNEAEQLLAESIRAKRLAGDEAGLVVALAQSGSIAVARGNFARAEQDFSQSAKKAAKLGLKRDQALSVFNRGRALQDIGKIAQALTLYKRAYSIASEGGYLEPMLLSLHAQSVAALLLGQHPTAAKHAKTLFTVARANRDRPRELTALGLIGMCHLAAGEFEKGRRLLAKVVRLAIAAGLEEAAIEALVESARDRSNGRFGELNINTLRRIANGQRRKDIAAAIWLQIAELEIRTRTNPSNVWKAFERAEQCLSHPSFIEQRMGVIKKEYSWASHSGDLIVALEATARMETLARQHRIPEEQAAALDQRGFCLQQMGRHNEARRFHVRALAIARRIDNHAQQQISLHNLGESYRHLGQHRAAIRVSMQSEKLARGAEDFEHAISTAHNRALALEELGAVRQAEKLLLRCKSEARHRRLWKEYVRALEGLANLQWMDGRIAPARRNFIKAIKEAKKWLVPQAEVSVAVNFARLLSAQRRSGEGVKLLRKYQESPDAIIDPQHFYGTLGSLYDDQHEPAKAAEAWEKARIYAEKLGDTGSTSYAAAKKAAALTRAGKPRLANSALRNALKTERDPARRVNLLIQQLELPGSKARSSRKAQATFEEAKELAEKYDLKEQKIALYLGLGDQQISGRYREQLSAFNAYVMALATSMTLGWDRTGEILAHILMKIASPGSPVAIQDLPGLVREVEQTLETQAPNAPAVVQLLTWPLRLAEKLAPYRRKPRLFVKTADKLLSKPEIAKFVDSLKIKKKTRRRKRAT